MNLLADKHKNTVDFDLKSTVSGNDLPDRANTTPQNKKRHHTFLCSVLGLVENTGIEPVTSCMPCKRSPS